MAKLYRISFSPVDQEIGDDKQKLNKRESERKLLSQLFEAQANATKSLKDSNLCLDCVGQIDNLTQADDTIAFTKGDIEKAQKGWESLAGNRPNGWFQCRELLKQVENPKEEEVV